MKRKWISNQFTSQNLFRNLLTAIWPAFSAGILILYLLINENQSFNKRSLASAFAVFTIIILFAVFHPSKINKRQCLLLVLTALAAGSMALLIFNSEFPSLKNREQNISVKILQMNPDTHLDLIWAYISEEQGTHSLSEKNTVQTADISFSQFRKTGQWNTTQDQFLSSDQADSALFWKNHSLRHITRITLCFQVTGGNAVIETDNGKKKETLTLSEKETGSQPAQIVFDFGKPSIFSSILMILTLSGIIVFFILFEFHICYSTKKNCWKDFIIYFLSFSIPTIVLLIICSLLGIFPFGEKTFMINDMFGEYGNYLSYLHGILTGENNIFYSFSKSLGDDILSLLSFYIINPLNFITCFFKPEDLPKAVSLLVILRFAISGLTCSIWLRKSRKCGYAAILFSSCYALMSYSMVNSENINLREGTMILPLVIWGIDRILDSKSEILYIVSLTSALFLNYYSAFQICIFAVIYVLFRTFSAPALFKQKKIILRHFALSSLLSGGTAAILLLPVALQLEEGQKSFSLKNLTGGLFNFSLPQFISKFFPGSFDDSQISSSGLPALFCGAIVLFLTFLLFLNKNISRREKILTGSAALLLFLSMELFPLNLIWHGMNPPEFWPYRYTFIVSFFMIFCAERCWENKAGLRTADIEWLFALFILGAFWILTKKYSYLSFPFAAVGITAGCITQLILFYSCRHPKEITFAGTLISCICIMEIGLNAYGIIREGTKYERSETVSSYRTYYLSNKPIFQELKNRDESFYRTEKNYQRNTNDAFELNYSGVAHYSSTLKKSIMTFLPAVGFRYFPFRFFYGEGSTVSIDSLLGIKYLVSGNNIFKPYSKFFEKNGKTVFKNTYALPISFLISEKSFQTPITFSANSFENQNSLLSALSQEKDAVFQPVQFLSEELNNLSETSENNQKIYRKIDLDKPAFIQWTLPAGSGDLLYVFFPSSEMHLTKIYLDGTYIGDYFDDHSPHMMSLGLSQKDRAITLRMVLQDKKVCFSDSLFYTENLSQLEIDYKILNQSGADLKKLSSSGLSGKITTEKNGYLFFSIPYDQGWHIRIDGKNASAQPSGGIFMAVKISAGTHSIKMQFIPRGFIPGAVITALSLVIGILILLLRKPNRSSQKADG